MMRYLSVCAGIEAATIAWHPLGWEAAAFSEIEAFPRAVLAHHYPEVPLHGDFTTIGADDYGAIDLLVGGTPCQSFSIAGLRGGLGDDRGNLALEFLRLADRKRPRWLVWENVPGVLSIDEGRAFGSILGGMGELGYGCAYRILDAQHFGVPQRRRRVFVVGYLGDWRRAAAVLFERHSLSGHSAPRREAREAVAALTANGVGTCGADDNQGQAGHLIAGTLNANGKAAGSATQQDAENGMLVAAFGGNNTSGPIDVAPALTSHGGPHGRQDFASETFIAFDCKGTQVQFYADGSHPTLRSMGHANSHSNAGGHAAVAFSIMPMNSGKDYKARETDIAQPLMAGGPVGGNQGGDFVVSVNENVHGVAFAENSRAELRLEGGDGNRTGALSTGGGKPGQGVPMIAGSAVRRLTPRECERLQGFPDDYTLVPVRGKPAADGPRYKALGNSMAVPVMRWIGERIAAVDAISQEARAA